MKPVRLPVWSALVCAMATGCAARQEPSATGGSRDDRRQEIARLDRQIADEEVDLGVRRAPASATADAERAATAGGRSVAPSQQVEAPPATPEVSPSPGVTSEQGQAAAPGPRFASPPPERVDGTCPRLCRSVAAICHAARRICRLADGLDDAWADDRCEAATRSCASVDQRAQSRCAGTCSP